MAKLPKALASSFVLLILVMQSALLPALPAKSQTVATPPAPVPTQIVAAKKVFIANAGGDQPFYDDPIFNGSPDRTYDQFYAGIKALGRYELVGSPAEADLLFEIQLNVPPANEKVVKDQTRLIPVPYDPYMRLVIRDPRTNALLWVFTEHVQWAILLGNRDKNFDQASARIVNDVQSLTLRSSTDASNVKPQEDLARPEPKIATRRLSLRPSRIP